MTQWGVLGAVAAKAVTGLVKAGMDEERDAQIHNLEIENKHLKKENEKLSLKVAVQQVTVDHLSREADGWQAKWREMFDKLLDVQNKLMIKDMHDIKVPVDENPYIDMSNVTPLEVYDGLGVGDVVLVKSIIDLTADRYWTVNDVDENADEVLNIEQTITTIHKLSTDNIQISTTDGNRCWLFESNTLILTHTDNE